MTLEELKANRLLNEYFTRTGNSIIAQKEAIDECNKHINIYREAKDKKSLDKLKHWIEVKEELEQY